ncbi:MAG: hypothetical protein R3C59_03150 [Planctomycetaceae bacterium]
MTAENTGAFLQLHRLLVQLEDAEQMLAHGPQRIAAVEKKIDLTQQACALQKEEIQRVRKLADGASLNLKSQEAEVTKQTLRLNEAKSNKEYQIIQGQSASAKAACEKLEDQVLGLLNDVDVATQKLKSLEQQLTDLRQKLAETRSEVQSAEPGLQAEVERLNAEIAEAEQMIKGGEARSTYKRLRTAMGAAAMSRVEDTYCTECNTGATPQDVVRMNMGEFVLCRACGRILYLTPTA